MNAIVDKNGNIINPDYTPPLGSKANPYTDPFTGGKTPYTEPGTGLPISPLGNYNPLPKQYSSLPKLPQNENQANFAPGAQPISSGKKSPYYFVPPDQYSPTPVRPNPTGNPSIDVLNQQHIYQQLIGTSVNVRNKSLQELLQAMNTPMEQMYAAQGVGQAAQGRGEELTNLKTNLASRGLSGSGFEDLGTRQANTTYLSNVAGAEAQAQQMADQRHTQQLEQLLNIPAEDLRFYQAIRGGQIPASNLWAAGSGMQVEDYRMLATGIGTAVRSAASAASGGGGGGQLGGGGMGGGGGGGASFMSSIKGFYGGGGK